MAKEGKKKLSLEERREKLEHEDLTLSFEIMGFAPGSAIDIADSTLKKPNEIFGKLLSTGMSDTDILVALIKIAFGTPKELLTAIGKTAMDAKGMFERTDKLEEKWQKLEDDELKALTDKNKNSTQIEGSGTAKPNWKENLSPIIDDGLQKLSNTQLRKIGKEKECEEELPKLSKESQSLIQSAKMEYLDLATNKRLEQRNNNIGNSSLNKPRIPMLRGSHHKANSANVVNVNRTGKGSLEI